METLEATKKQISTLWREGLDALKKKRWNEARRFYASALELSLQVAKDPRETRQSEYSNRAEEFKKVIQKIDEKTRRSPSSRQSPSSRAEGSSTSSSSQSSFGGNQATQDDVELTSFFPAERPKIKLADIAGLDEVKEIIRDSIIIPREHPDLFASYGKKRGMGILLYGVPGTGKTMFAKAIAGELGAPIFPVKCSDIASRYFGDSEKNISNLFAEARKYETAIIFFDEFEALGSSRDDSSSPMKRIVPELLTQMQGFEENPNNLILIAASNRPWEIDSAFIRTGRFSNHIMVPLPDKAARRVIVTNALKGIKISPQDLERIIEASEGYSGADLALQGGLCEKMKDCSIRRRLADGTPDSTEPEIIQSDIEAAFKLARKSVKQSDLDRIREFYLSEHL